MRRRIFSMAALSMTLPSGTLRAAASSIAAFRAAGITFSVPSGWTTEDTPDGKALFLYLLSGPNLVDASMMIELFTDATPRTAEQSIDDMIEGAKRRHSDYRELERGRRNNSVGLGYAFVKFEVPRQGSPFTEQYAVVPVAGSTRVNLYSSCDRYFSPKAQPAFDQLIQSLRIVT